MCEHLHTSAWKTSRFSIKFRRKKYKFSIIYSIWRETWHYCLKKLAGLLLTDLVAISQILKFYYYFLAELKYSVDAYQKELKKSPL